MKNMSSHVIYISAFGRIEYNTSMHAYSIQGGATSNTKGSIDLRQPEAVTHAWACMHLCNSGL